MELGSVIDAAKNLDVAFVTLFGGLILGRLAGKLCARLLKEAEVERMAEGVSDLLGHLVSYIIYFIAVVLVLQQFQLTSVALTIVLVVVFAGVALVVLFVLGDLAPNFVLGFLLRGKLKRFLGKRVQIGKAQGVLVSAGWIDCVLKDKEVFALPYRYVRTQKVNVLR